MSKRSELPTIKRHLAIYEEDWHWLEANFGLHTANAVGAGKAIRLMVHKRVRELKAKVVARLDEGSPDVSTDEAIAERLGGEQ
jgi:hypothetical protein